MGCGLGQVRHPFLLSIDRVELNRAVAVAMAFDAAVRLHGSAGHDLTLDAPEWTLEQIVQWLDARAFPALPSDEDAGVRDRQQAEGISP